MTPAIDSLKKLGIDHQIHKYQVDDQGEGYGLAAAKALNVAPNQLFKTLIIATEADSSTLAVAIVPVSKQLSLKHAAVTLGWKKAVMANQIKAQKATGYILGGISPLGQKKSLPMMIDQSCQQFDIIYVSAGKRGMQVSLNTNELIKRLNITTAHITG